MTTLRFRATEPTLTVPVLSHLRKITTLSISELRNRAATGEALLEITPFQTNWQDMRVLLVQIARDIAAGSLPLAVTEAHNDRESPVSTQMLHNLIKLFRQIEMDTQCETQLELGEISDPSEFSPYDKDWTQ